MINPNIWENKKWQPNHQPVYIYTILYTHYFFWRYLGVSHKWGISNMDGLQMFLVENIIQMDEDIMGM